MSIVIITATIIYIAIVYMSKDKGGGSSAKK